MTLEGMIAIRRTERERIIRRLDMLHKLSTAHNRLQLERVITVRELTDRAEQLTDELSELGDTKVFTLNAD